MKEITVTELAALDHPAVVDVREQSEYDTVHAEGVRLIPLGELVQRVDEVPRTGPVYVVCHLGGRSAQATSFLAAQGIDAINVVGGMDAWQRAGLPVSGKA
ncbi:rhodanese-like domain-containing protein [Cryobacterium sp. 5I3]|uniref:rhodanese-like domain-containing protein n=1 Tax=Cryobacterium sp. 5I3 TaxID=3048592 RepID=UPI002B2281DA|nr:rhodanese-like domain-containing protein [Cryobacterium sp. 5I3]MEB0201759.1 rhodanese-like domain-containing protein [Cryobacterium sp. 5I3]